MLEEVGKEKRDFMSRSATGPLVYSGTAKGRYIQLPPLSRTLIFDLVLWMSPTWQSRSSMPGDRALHAGASGSGLKNSQLLPPVKPTPLSHARITSQLQVCRSQLVWPGILGSVHHALDGSRQAVVMSREREPCVDARSQTPPIDARRSQICPISRHSSHTATR